MELKKIIYNIYHIKENGLISTPDFGEGRLIPAVVVNKENDTTLQELILTHKDTPPGDILTQWTTPFSRFFKPKVWHLQIIFTQPMNYTFEIEFNLEKDYPLIDAIQISRGLFLGFGNTGDKISHNKNGMILLEIADTNLELKWNNTLNNILIRKFKKIGVKNSEIKDEIKSHISDMRNILLIRKNNKNT